MKPVTRLFISALVLGLSSSFSIAGNAKHHQDWDTPEVDGLAEPILGVIYHEKGLEFQVQSTGCTEKDHFVMQRLSLDSQVISQLLLIRVQPDFCDAYVPFGVRISYSYDELGLEENESFTLLNPLSSYRVVRF